MCWLVTGYQASVHGSVKLSCRGHGPKNYPVTLVVLTLCPRLQLHPDRSGSSLHASPRRQGSIWHHHLCRTMAASTQEGCARVVPATRPDAQEHLTVWERSSPRCRLQQR